MNITSIFSDDFHWPRDAEPVYDKYWYIFAIGGLVYMPLIFGLQNYMKDRKPLRIKKLLLLWNIALTLFSALGTYYTVPTLYSNVVSKGILASVCDWTIYDTPQARWIFWFNMSKLLEFGDTIFVVLCKRPLIFLHWYHHITTMIYCWYCNQHSYGFHAGGWWFAAMNLSIHTVMYLYYALSCLGYKANWNFLLTTGQILQMIVGVSVVCLSALCTRVNYFEIFFGLVMYMSYLYLFCVFFMDKYVKNKKKGE
eukprot:TRINITY_DN2276_c0_g2_i1.p1 TRINITY_DN2276_c0_g2~~TRINITY_DN2276_c0_g2_i1.p1  ORF type:complete len:253 (+),score=9.62 TRINITY_DN2276_c0_g2_i1:58-816(+)